ncbi:hypothetical protein AB4559_22015 [Vibrio sp. 10N.222.51.C8]|uniref:hypothetical protein n=1 Tax=Vibrio sp. 10N.222.51.C8 TaxID=3229624 RepID=UPI003551261A
MLRNIWLLIKLPFNFITLFFIGLERFLNGIASVAEVVEYETQKELDKQREKKRNQTLEDLDIKEEDLVLEEEK